MKRISTQLAALVLAAVAAGCTDAAESPVDAAPPAEPQEVAAFYYHGDERIPLAVDPGQISLSLKGFEPAGGSPRASAEIPAVRAALLATGVDAGVVQQITSAPGHVLVELPAGRTAAEAVRRVAELRASGRFDFVANSFRHQDGGARVTLVDRVVVRLRDGAGPADVARLNAEFGTRVVRGPSAMEPHVWWLSYPAGADPLEVAARLHRHSVVAWADPDKVQERQLFATPSDPMYPSQNYLRSNTFRNGIRVDANAELAWNLSYGAWSAAAGPFKVAVVDAGVQRYHPDLGGSFAIGFDAVTGSWDSWGCTDCASNPTAGIPDMAHGTAVAGVIAGTHNNGIGIAGLAPAVQIMPVRIARYAPHISGGLDWATDAELAVGINTAWYNGAQVMNNSWGWGPSTTVTDAINRATNEGRGGKGTVMVFAVGNNSNRSAGQVAAIAYPARLANVLAVGALNSAGNVANYSNGGTELDVVAVGGESDFVTTDITGSAGFSSTEYVTNLSGTSFSAPQAAAVAAMILSRNPTWTEAQVRQRIKDTADPWGVATTFGAGKLNAYRALVGRINVSISGNRYPSAPGTQTYTANASGGAGGYTYVWERSVNGGGWTQVSTSSSYSTYVGYDAVISLRVTVRDSAGDGHSRTAIASVRGPYSGSNCNTLEPTSGSIQRLPAPCPITLEP